MADSLYIDDSPSVFMNDEPIRMHMLSGEIAVPIVTGVEGVSEFDYIRKLQETVYVYRESAKCFNGCSHTNLPMIVRFIHGSRDFLSISYNRAMRQEDAAGHRQEVNADNLVGYCLIEVPMQPRVIDDLGMYRVAQDVEHLLVAGTPREPLPRKPPRPAQDVALANISRIWELVGTRNAFAGQSHFGKLQMTRHREGQDIPEGTGCSPRHFSWRGRRFLSHPLQSSARYERHVYDGLRSTHFRNALERFQQSAEVAWIAHPAGLQGDGLNARAIPVRLGTQFTDDWIIDQQPRPPPG
jgi:hypothetical protein